MRWGLLSVLCCSVDGVSDCDGEVSRRLLAVGIVRIGCCVERHQCRDVSTRIGDDDVPISATHCGIVVHGPRRHDGAAHWATASARRAFLLAR